MTTPNVDQGIPGGLPVQGARGEGYRSQALAAPSHMSYDHGEQAGNDGSLLGDRIGDPGVEDRLRRPGVQHHQNGGGLQSFVGPSASHCQTRWQHQYENQVTYQQSNSFSNSKLEKLHLKNQILNVKNKILTPNIKIMTNFDLKTNFLTNYQLKKLNI